LLQDFDLRRVAASLIVCFDGIVEPGGERDPYMLSSRITRQGVRLLERKALLDNFRIVIEGEINSFVVCEAMTEPFAYSETIEKWFQQNVSVDANNALLLRLDEWAVCDSLSAAEVTMFAAGEKGGVPQEHRNTPAAWAAQRVKGDAEYRRVMLLSKANDKHVGNVFVCFSAMLEQHFGFDWMARCFVATLNPSVALHKIRQYKASAHSKTPPLVVQLPEGQAELVSPRGRVRCESPNDAISAWISYVEHYSNGSYTRKANVSDILERLRQTSHVAVEVGDELTGARIQIQEEDEAESCD
jgi:hypothetical protein